ncbi:hypothetical protein HBI23_181910 [Parastagonospora nodorum]|nr:hypothetical protein HBI12_173130 [Parastagonospora nodorum]KAH5647046.1 hypothetical protein HBI23_181910 [Parastagonospora nodorum]
MSARYDHRNTFSSLMDIHAGIRRADSVYADSIDGVSIRLLRLSRREDGDFDGKLQTFLISNAPPFYTASYVWGATRDSGIKVHLSGGPLPVLPSLAPFLHMITENGEFNENDWWWIDSLCINLTDGNEREQQVRIMADIYKRAKRAVIWLGEEKEPGSDCTGAIGFLHKLASLQVAFSGDDRAMRESLDDPDFISNCKAVSKLLYRPWWTRVWTLQEFVLPKEAKLYCGSESISRGKFKSAVYSIFLCSTISNEFEHELVPRDAFTGAFNRRRIHQLHTKADAQGISLIALMAYLGNHAATDSRDRIFSVLGLVTGKDRSLVGPAEYSSTTQTQFAKLVQTYWSTYGDLDIICFVHLFSRYGGPSEAISEEEMPSWVPDWSATINFASPVPLMVSQSPTTHIGNFRPIHSVMWKAKYDAPGSYLRKRAHVEFSEDMKDLWCEGVILDTIHGLAALDDRELRCRSFVCAKQGHDVVQSKTSQTQAPRATMLPMDWLEGIAQSLVLGRKDKYLCDYAPQHYVWDFVYLCHACIANDPVDWSFASWFELNRNMKFGSQILEELVRAVPMEGPISPPPLRRPASYPIRRADDNYAHRLDTFLTRFHDTARKKARRLLVTNEGLIGAAPCRARDGDVVTVLFCCSIPLVLRKQEATDEAWQVIGEAYMHGFMSGETAGLFKRGKKSIHRIHLV